MTLRNFYGWQRLNFLNFLSVTVMHFPEQTVISAIWRHRRHETYARDLVSHFWNVQNVDWRHPPNAYSFRAAGRRVRTWQDNSVRVNYRSPSEDTWRSTQTVSTSRAWLPIAAKSPSLARPPIVTTSIQVYPTSRLSRESGKCVTTCSTSPSSTLPPPWVYYTSNG